MRAESAERAITGSLISYHVTRWGTFLSHFALLDAQQRHAVVCVVVSNYNSIYYYDHFLWSEAKPPPPPPVPRMLALLSCLGVYSPVPSSSESF